MKFLMTVMFILTSHSAFALSEADTLSVDIVDFDTKGLTDKDITKHGFKNGYGDAEFALRFTANTRSPYYISFVKDIEIEESTESISITMQELVDDVIEQNKRRNLSREEAINLLTTWKLTPHLVEYDWAGFPQGFYSVFIGKADKKVDLSELTEVSIDDRQTVISLDLEASVK